MSRTVAVVWLILRLFYTPVFGSVTDVNWQFETKLSREELIHFLESAYGPTRTLQDVAKKAAIVERGLRLLYVEEDKPHSSLTGGSGLRNAKEERTAPLSVSRKATPGEVTRQVTGKGYEKSHIKGIPCAPATYKTEKRLEPIGRSSGNNVSPPTEDELMKALIRRIRVLLDKPGQ